jgi:NADH-quinone oxidoreductase subunit L
MTVPLMILAILSVLGGVLNIPEIFGGHASLNSFLSTLFKVSGEGSHISHISEIILMTVTVLAALVMWRSSSSLFGG